MQDYAVFMYIKATEVIEIKIRSQTIIALISLKVCGHLLASPGEGRRS